MYAPKVGDGLDSLDTPSMIVDIDLMEANIKRLDGAHSSRLASISARTENNQNSAILARKLSDRAPREAALPK